VDQTNKDFQELKPLTPGLGIHHRAKRMNTPAFKTTPLSNNNKVKRPADLELFYRPNKEVIIENKVEPTKTQSNYQRVSFNKPWEKLLAAWTIDTALVILGCLAPFMIATSFISLNLEDFLTVLMSGKNLFALIPLLAFGYIGYFAAMDSSTSGTFGKKLMGLTLQAEMGTTPSFTQAATRSAISFVSLFVFGLPLVIGFQDFLSGTRIISHD